MTFEMISQ